VDQKAAARLIARADGFPSPAVMHVPRRMEPMTHPYSDGTPFSQERIAQHDLPTGLMMRAGLVWAQDRMTTSQLPGSRQVGSSFNRNGALERLDVTTFAGQNAYAHRIDIARRRADDPEVARDWAEDTDAEYARLSRGSGHTAGWEVTVARPEVIELGKFEGGLGDATLPIGTLSARFTWRWRPTKSGEFLDPAGPAFAGLTPPLKDYARRFHGGLDPAAVHRGVVHMRHSGKRWEVVRVETEDKR
jgi:hypothetical protein